MKNDEPPNDKLRLVADNDPGRIAERQKQVGWMMLATKLARLWQRWSPTCCMSKICPKKYVG